MFPSIEDYQPDRYPLHDSRCLSEHPLNDTDKKQLSLLQEKVRYSAVEFADRIGFGDDAARNRMNRLDDDGIMTGKFGVHSTEARVRPVLALLI